MNKYLKVVCHFNNIYSIKNINEKKKERGLLPFLFFVFIVVAGCSSVPEPGIGFYLHSGCPGSAVTQSDEYYSDSQQQLKANNQCQDQYKDCSSSQKSYHAEEHQQQLTQGLEYHKYLSLKRMCPGTHVCYNFHPDNVAIIPELNAQFFAKSNLTKVKCRA